MFQISSVNASRSVIAIYLVNHSVVSLGVSSVPKATPLLLEMSRGSSETSSFHSSVTDGDRLTLKLVADHLMPAIFLSSALTRRASSPRHVFAFDRKYITTSSAVSQA